MLTHVEFQSDSFPPYDSEDDDVNPGRYGKRLAEYIATSLPRQGQIAGEIFAEDWGWVVPIDNPDFSLWIGVGNSEEYANGFLCFIEPAKPLVRRFPRFWVKIRTVERVQALQTALDKVLQSHPGISGVRWWTEQQFNSPGREP